LANKRLLITGGTGFIGKWLLSSILYSNELLNLKIEIYVISRNPDLFIKKFPELVKYSNIHIIKGNILCFDYTLLPSFDYVIHAATDITEMSSSQDYLKIGYEGTQRLFDHLENSKNEVSVLYLSSGAVYGNSTPKLGFFQEDYEGAPRTDSISSSYGESKRLGELLCAIYSSRNDFISVKIARCFSFVGPYLPLDKHFAIGNFIKSAIIGEDILIHGDGKAVRTYMYGSDLSVFLLKILLEAKRSSIYNVGGAEGISIADLANLVVDLTSSSSNVRILGQNKSQERNIYVPSIELIRRELNIEPKISLSESIIRTYSWNKKLNYEKY
jgi:dTDP-glucose 4,6-dehydratase